MEPRLQRRIQRYGWDLAAAAYDRLWQDQLAPARAALMTCAGLIPGERVLDVACGTGITALEAAARVSPGGDVVGIDLSDRMIGMARGRALQEGCGNVGFERANAENLALPDGSFDAVLCALGLMYMPCPERALAEMRRELRPDGRIVLAVWGNRSRCGWASLFPIVDAEVASDVCPLFFRLGQDTALADVCATAGFAVATQSRLPETLVFADAEHACNAAFVGGPVALAWSRMAAAARERVRIRYLDSITAWRCQDGTYRIPGEFVIVAASVQPLRPLSPLSTGSPCP
jgi:ubiquinone/menaquinone biosynthesis C-methylase UbiE